MNICIKSHWALSDQEARDTCSSFSSCSIPSRREIMRVLADFCNVCKSLIVRKKASQHHYSWMLLGTSAAVHT